MNLRCSSACRKATKSWKLTMKSKNRTETMAGGTLPQKRGGGNLKHNELIAPKMVCDKREGTTQGAPILLPRAQR